LDIPWLRQPINIQLKALSEELRQQWLALERELRPERVNDFDTAGFGI
jgi:hypothetical protein